MPEFDAHPANILGKGILDPDKEAELIARGIMFAVWLPPDKRGHQVLLTSHRPYADVLNGRMRPRGRMSARK